MARAPRPTEPVYNHEPERLVPLRYPFTVGGSKLERLPLNPPSFRDLQFLRAKDLVDGADVLSIMSGLSVEVVGALRWPDVEAAIAEAFELLPPEFVEAFKAGGETPPEAEKPSAAIEEPVDVIEEPVDVIDLEAPDDDPGPLNNFFE